jgi:hypothetical protein
MQKQVERKVCLTAKMLENKIDEVKGAVMICYPMGLPQWDAMRLILEGQGEGASAVRQVLLTRFGNFFQRCMRRTRCH